MKRNFSKNKNGYTLIEMMIAVTLFSVVLTITLGSVMTIIDVNRKSQSLTVVMNDLNFALETMTRTIKTGEILSPDVATGYIFVRNQDGDTIRYQFNSENSSIDRYVNGGEAVPLTSSQIEIDVENSGFEVFQGNDNRQPRILMKVAGEVRTSPKISSAFSLQTSISQRRLFVENLSN